jgi:hypothetical protein
LRLTHDMPPAPGVAADPALDQLLFVIALVKSVVTVGALVLLRWRLRHPMGHGRRMAYATSAAAMCIATGLLLARVALPLVPFLFDGGLVALVLLALTDAPMLRLLAVRFPNRDAVRVRPLHGRRVRALQALLRASSATALRRRG